MTRYEGMKPPDDIVRLQLDIKAAIAHVMAHDTAHSHPMSTTFQWASVHGPDGYTELGEHFVDIIGALQAPRRVTSLLIMDLVTSMREATGFGPFREKVVSHATPFMNVLVREVPRVLLDWVEDMVTNFATLGLVRQPLAMISGTLFAPMFNQSEASALWTFRPARAPYRIVRMPFWDQAARSSSFPKEIFSEPCSWDEGSTFSPHRLRMFASIFSLASDTVVKTFATRMRHYATQKKTQPVKPEDWETQGVLAPVDENELVIAYRDLVASIDAGPERRALVARSLGLA